MREIFTNPNDIPRRQMLQTLGGGLGMLGAATLFSSEYSGRYHRLPLAIRAADGPEARHQLPVVRAIAASSEPFRMHVAAHTSARAESR